jgi:hypothetical protein
MSFRLSGSDLAVSFVAIASCESSLGSSGSSDDGRSKSDDETELVMMFWWLCYRCAVGIAAVVNAVRRGGAALVCVVMEMMCWFDATVEYAVQCVWAGCGVASRKWCSVNSCVASGLCGFAVAIVNTTFSRMVMATVCGAMGAVQGSGMSAKLGVEFEQCPRTYVAAQTDQECKPDTSVSVVENMDSLETEATAAVCIPTVVVDLGTVVEPCVSGKNSCCASCTSKPLDVVLVQQVLEVAELAMHHAVNECGCGAYVSILPVVNSLETGVQDVDSLCEMVQVLYEVEQECHCKCTLKALDVVQTALQYCVHKLMDTDAMGQPHVEAGVNEQPSDVPE